VQLGRYNVAEGWRIVEGMRAGRLRRCETSMLDNS
jgi:hypothetical protein